MDKVAAHDKWVCIGCRWTAKIEFVDVRTPNRPSYRCPKCRTKMVWAGTAFRPPRKGDDEGWLVVEQLPQTGAWARAAVGPYWSGLAAYAGAGIARANPFWTGVTASKLAVGAFIVPYIFVYNPAMVLIGTTPFLLTQNLLTACLGMFGVGAAMIGFCVAPMNWFERIWFGIAGLMLIDPGAVTDVIGIVMLAIGLFFQYRKKKVWVAEGAPTAAN